MRHAPADTTAPDGLRTCPDCGKHKPTEAFSKAGGRRCRVCWSRRKAAKAARRRDVDQAYRLQSNRRVARWLAQRSRDTIANARVWHKPYTKAEDAVLLDGGVPHLVAASTIGRTLWSVVQRRVKLAQIHGLPAAIRGHAANARKYPRVTPSDAAA